MSTKNRLTWNWKPFSRACFLPWGQWATSAKVTPGAVVT